MQQNDLTATISRQYIQDYVERALPGGRWQSGGREWVCPSPYLQNDYKKHFSINVESGLWQCFKTGKQGNFVQIYAFLENLSPRAVWARLVFQSIENGESQDLTPLPETEKVFAWEVGNDEWFVPLTSTSNLDNELVNKAFHYLNARRIFPTKDSEYYVCVGGKYEGRLIFPYTDEDNEIYYFQARALDSRTPKYLNPGSEEGVRASNVLYPFDTGPVMVTEGPIDAISLKKAGYNATCTNGSHVSDVQALQLKDHSAKIIMAYDNDEAGKRGVLSFENTRKRLRMDNFFVCYPPSEYSDWNEFLCSEGQGSLQSHIAKNTHRYESFYRIREELGLI